MRLFKKRLQAALSTPEALAVRAERAQDAPSQAWRENAAPMRSYVTER
jgi:hypothetical protein